MSEAKTHLGVVIVGTVDAGKSTTTGHLLFELGGLSQRELDKLKAEAEALGKGSFAFAFFMDKNKDERARGVTIQCATKEFYTDNYHYTIIDAPGHKDFIKNMISGASQADVAVILVPADGNFEASIQKENRKKGKIEGQSKAHARLCKLLGIEQVIVAINKMDSDVCNWSQDRYNEIKDEMARVLKGIGYKPKNVPFIPMSGWTGDNLVKPSDKAPWYKGFNVKRRDGTRVEGVTLLDALDKYSIPPKRNIEGPMRMPVSGVFKIKGVGDVITGRVEQGQVKPGQMVRFVPSCTSGKVFSVEMHHKSVEAAGPGDNVGLNIKGLNKNNMPRTGDVMFVEGESDCGVVTEFTALVHVQSHPGQLKPPNKDGKGGFTPSVHIRSGRAPCKLVKINWKMGKSTGKEKIENPPFLKSGEQAEAVFECKMPFYCEDFKSCPGLGRVAFMDSNRLVMLGKIKSVKTRPFSKK